MNMTGVGKQVGIQDHLTHKPANPLGCNASLFHYSRIFSEVKIHDFENSLFCLLQLGIAPLMDNDAADNYYYEIVTVTGMRKNAGTDSKVRM